MDKNAHRIRPDHSPPDASMLSKKDRHHEHLFLSLSVGRSIGIKDYYLNYLQEGYRNWVFVSFVKKRRECDY